MAELTVFSKHIPLKDIQNADALCNDIALFNRIMHTACAKMTRSKRDGETDTRPLDDEGNPVDLRKAENKKLLAAQPESLHCALKERFKTNDYFTNSARQAASASIRSQEELRKDYIKDKEDRRKSVKKKRDKDRKRLNGLRKVKASLVRRSLAVKKNRTRAEGKKPVKVPDPSMPQGGLVWFDKEHGVFCLRTFPGSKQADGKRDVIYAWPNDYLFELTYLDPEIKRLEAKVKNLQKRYVRLGLEIEKLKNEVRGICFGTRKLFRKQDTVYTDHKVWRNAWTKARSRGMTLSGRSDAEQGNFLVRYDTETCVLTYRSQCGKEVKMKALFPFHGDLVSKAVNAKKAGRRAVAWRFELTHGSVLVKCIVTVSDERKNWYYGNGCVSFDTNADNLSVTILDGSGNILRHKVFYFDLEGKSSGERTWILSNVLEEVFAMAMDAKVPIAMEDLKIKLKNLLYGSAVRNRVLTSFAYRKVTMLAESKSGKYGIALTKVDPKYTSQMGKVKFARKYGITVHEAAAACIGRRALGIREKLPAFIKEKLDPKDQKRSRKVQWKKAYQYTKDLTVHKICHMQLAC